jgi:hypothetical protein
MSQEERFYELRTFVCPRCHVNLQWKQRPGIEDSMMLVHPPDPTNWLTSCRLAGKNFYAPVEHLCEIPQER